MKKGIFLLTILFILGCGSAGFASDTFDATGDSSNSSITGVLSNFKCSKNVEVHVTSSAQSYAAVSGHKSGDRKFGAGSGDSKIYYKSKTKGTALSDSDGPSDSNATSVFTTSNGWSTL